MTENNVRMHAAILLLFSILFNFNLLDLSGEASDSDYQCYLQQGEHENVEVRREYFLHDSLVDYVVRTEINS